MCEPSALGPLTGIESFDVPPYRFDLSPFVGRHNNGSHEITVSVVKNSNSGVWCPNPTVVLEEGPTSAQWTGGHPFRSRSTDLFSSVEQFNLTTGPALHILCASMVKSTTDRTDSFTRLQCLLKHRFGINSVALGRWLLAHCRARVFPSPMPSGSLWKACL